MFGRAIGIGLAAIAVVAIVGVGGNLLMTASSVLTAPGRVIQRTLDTDNIITSYEWYYDTWKQFDARVGQINSHLTAMKAAKTDGGDNATIDRYRVEAEGMKQSCRDMAAKYNANSAKINKVIFKGRDAPATLNPGECEGAVS